jgi:hypothetical protein
MESGENFTATAGPETSFLATLFNRLTTTIRSLKSESLLRLHELLDCDRETEDTPPLNPHWRATVDLVEGELLRRGVAVRRIPSAPGVLVAGD